MRRNKRQTQQQEAIQAFKIRQQSLQEPDDSLAKHQQQAELALQSELVTALRKDSLARRVANSIIELFPDVKPELDEDGQQTKSRTAVASQIVREGLTTKDRQDDSAIRLGMRQANTALRRADHYLKTYRSSIVDKIDSNGSTLVHT